mgnify:CR=1 FL=1
MADILDEPLLPPEERPSLDIQDIMELLPHRYPFLLVDRVIEFRGDNELSAIKNCTINEEYFQGHYPGQPIMPGVLQIEAMAQLGAVLIAHMPQAQGKLSVFAGIDKVRFRHMVAPGDRLDMRCELTRFRLPIGKAVCKATVNGEIVLHLPQSTSAVLSAQVGNGTITLTGLTLTNEVRTATSLRGTLGAGDGMVSLQTTNGAIRVDGTT